MVLGLPTDTNTNNLLHVAPWPAHEALGLVMISDANGPEGAPAISSSMLSVLSQRIEVYLRDHCAVSEVERIPSIKFQGNQGLSSLIDLAKKHHVKSVILALFSSTESTQPGMFGESRMMTQIPGTTIHNSALVELGLFDVEKGMLKEQIYAEATESLDQLVSPIGDDNPTPEEGLDILRANAGQQALDKALPDFTQGCADA